MMAAKRKKEKNDIKDKSLTKLKIFGFVMLALGLSAVVWFFVNVL